MRACVWMFLAGIVALGANAAEEVVFHGPATWWSKVSSHKAGDFVEHINPTSGETTREEVLPTAKKNTLVRRVTVKPKDKDATIYVVVAIYDLPNEAGFIESETKPISTEIEIIEVDGTKLKTEKQKFVGEKVEFYIWECEQVPLGGVVKRMVGKDVVELLTKFGRAKE